MVQKDPNALGWLPQPWLEGNASASIHPPPLTEDMDMEWPVLAYVLHRETPVMVSFLGCVHRHGERP